MKDEKYAVVTTISQFRIRYAVPLSDLQMKNPDCEVQPEWAADSVTLNELEEFSQEHIGETILDVQLEDEELILKRFDRENEYLSEWSKEQKIAWIKKCWQKRD